MRHPETKELELMCPNNPIGSVDLFVVSRHGQPSSNSEVLVHAIQPRVAIMNNGPRKGGQPDAMRIIHSAPRLEDLWQVHFSVLSGNAVPGCSSPVRSTSRSLPCPLRRWCCHDPRRTSAGAPTTDDTGSRWRRSGGFTVTNSRNGFSKTYRATAE
jgi:hypothetical protein